MNDALLSAHFRNADNTPTVLPNRFDGLLAVKTAYLQHGLDAVRIPSAPYSRRDLIKWWEGRRLRSKLMVGAVGIVTCLLVLCVGSLTAQNGGISSSGRGKTSAEELKSYGIELSEPSLLAALRNSNPKVRMLAAHQLQSDRDTDAIPAIQNALSVEKDSRAGVGIATALSAMHDPKGTEYLQAMCADSTQSIRVIFEATQMLSAAQGPKITVPIQSKM